MSSHSTRVTIQTSTYLMGLVRVNRGRKANNGWTVGRMDRHTLAFIGVVVLCRSPRLVVVESCAAITVWAGSVVLTHTVAMNLE